MEDIQSTGHQDFDSVMFRHGNKLTNSEFTKKKKMKTMHKTKFVFCCICMTWLKHLCVCLCVFSGAHSQSATGWPSVERSVCVSSAHSLWTPTSPSRSTDQAVRKHTHESVAHIDMHRHEPCIILSLDTYFVCVRMSDHVQLWTSMINSALGCGDVNAVYWKEK